jgi:outer membrane protein assembly factor BamE (lipoprotein component of BamABCDE complex)
MARRSPARCSITSRRTEQTSLLTEKTTDQRVVAVYFDKSRVQRIANYGIQDGKVLDSISHTTPTGGQELNYLTYIFKIFGGK